MEGLFVFLIYRLRHLSLFDREGAGVERGGARRHLLSVLVCEWLSSVSISRLKESCCVFEASLLGQQHTGVPVSV